MFINFNSLLTVLTQLSASCICRMTFSHLQQYHLHFRDLKVENLLLDSNMDIKLIGELL